MTCRSSVCHPLRFPLCGGLRSDMICIASSGHRNVWNCCVNPCLGWLVCRVGGVVYDVLGCEFCGQLHTEFSVEQPWEQGPQDCAHAHDSSCARCFARKHRSRRGICRKVQTHMARRPVFAEYVMCLSMFDLQLEEAAFVAPSVNPTGIDDWLYSSLNCPCLEGAARCADVG